MSAKATTKRTLRMPSSAGKGGIIVTGGAAALLTLGAWDKSSEILERMSHISAQQDVLTVTVGAIKEQVFTQLGRTDERIAEGASEVKALEQRVRLIETAIATMGSKKP